MRGVALVVSFLVIASAIFAGWYSNQRRDYFPQALQRTFSDCDVAPGQEGRQLVLDPFEDEWLSGELSALDEPSLFDRDPQAPRSVRFTWLRSFDPGVVVRIDTVGPGKMRLKARQASLGSGGDRVLERDLTLAEVASLTAVLQETGLFTLPPAGCRRGPDGARWIIEGADPALGYRFRSQHSPGDGPERTLGLHLLALTGWDFGRVY